MKPDYDHLYRFGENFRPFARGLRAGPEDNGLDANGITLGIVRPKQAVRFVHASGKRLCDVIWTTYLPLVLISKRLRDLLEHEQLTGWSTYPVSVHANGGNTLCNYFGLSVTGRAGPIDNRRSRKVSRGPKLEKGSKFQRCLGMFFKDDEWDGSDIFVPEKTTFIIMTERAKDAIGALKIPNVEFDSLRTLERDIPRSAAP